MPRDEIAGPVGEHVGSDSAAFVVHLLGLAAFLWNGLYILTRGEGGSMARPPTLNERFTGCRGSTRTPITSGNGAPAIL
jgi:hypothetical protein